MPDWSYHALLRPGLAALPPGGRARALRAASRFAATRPGGAVIAFVGHTRPPPAVAASVEGLALQSFLGAGAELSGDGALAPLLSRFGLGFVEVDATRDVPDAPVPVGARLPRAPEATLLALVARLAPRVAFFTLEPPESGGSLEVVRRAAADAGRPLLLVARTVEDVRRLRAEGLPVLAAGGVVEPADALARLDAGATLVALDPRLAEAGPGLPKRVHEAVQHRAQGPPRRGARAGWVAMLLLGLGMMVAGAVAWGVAATRVVLPYDEAFVGMTRDQLAALNPRLLPFLTHDRITLAGTMMSIGVLYAMLALHAQRDGAHWARRVTAVSATVGFASFFLYLGFGYFDPLHALISLALLPFFLVGLRGPADQSPRVPAPDLRNDRAWRRALWGQLAFVTLGVGLVLAGLYVSVVGSTRVFVREDLAYLQTTAEAIRAANARLPALIAHDRAGLGGALVSDGLAVLLVALWGVRRGAAWVWWMLLASGLVGFGAALGVHAAVGYVDARHVAPALLALAIYAAGLAWLRPYLMAVSPASPAGRESR